MPRVKDQAQLALDEEVVDDPATIAARSVTFETKASSRLRIGLAESDESEAAAASDDDDADLRPTGEVNTDALRGEVDRATIGEPTRLRPGGRSAGRNASRGPQAPLN